MRIFAFALVAAAAGMTNGKLKDMGEIKRNTHLVCDFAAMEYEEFNILRFVEVRSKQGRAIELRCDCCSKYVQ